MNMILANSRFELGADGGTPRARVILSIAVLTFATFGAALCAEPQPQQGASTSCPSASALPTTLDVTRFGAKPDRTTDNSGPFSAAMDFAARCHVHDIHVPAGTYLFMPRGPTTGILLPSHISLFGDGADKSILVVARTSPTDTFASFFWARNQDNIEIRDLGFRGSNAAIADRDGHPLNNYGSAISIVLDEHFGLPQNGQPRDLHHFKIAGATFENFNGAAWIAVRNYNAAFTIDDVEIQNNHFTSGEGNAINPGNIGSTSVTISVNGSLTSPKGLVTNVRLTDNAIDAAHIKGGIAIWSGVRGAMISRNKIANAGADRMIPNDRGAYAITVYNNAYFHDSAHEAGAPMGGTRPDDVTISDNEITNPRSCGIYVAGAARILITENVISGQTDPENHTLPKGAIALNQPLDATVTNNRISGSIIGMSLYEGTIGHIAASRNEVSEIPTGGMVFDKVRPQAHENN